MQLFSFRIGAAQAAKGAKVISTNTDGLYSVMEKTLNDQILETEAKNIHVDIEPEPLFLISKDTNNRIELSEDLSTIISASGGTVGCRKGPNPEKSLSHPAIIDWALSEYLIACAKQEGNANIAKPFDETLGREILSTRARDEFKEPHKYLQMFQNVIASSPGSTTYVYGTTDENPYDPIVMQHYNRAFYMKDGTPNTIHVQQATARKMTPAEIKGWKEKKDTIKKDERIASIVLVGNGEPIEDIKSDNQRRIVSKKVTNVDPEWYIRIDNRDLHLMDQASYDDIMEHLDIDKYLMLLKDGFESNWMNVLPEEPMPGEIIGYLNDLKKLGTITDGGTIKIPITNINDFKTKTELLFTKDKTKTITPTLDLETETCKINLHDLPFESVSTSTEQIDEWLKTAMN